MLTSHTDFVGADPSGECATAADIIAGKYDSPLIAQADAIKTLKVPIALATKYPAFKALANDPHFTALPFQ